MKCNNCNGTGKIKMYNKKDDFKKSTLVNCNWCNGTGIQMKFL